MLTEGMYLADRYEIVGKVGAGGMSDVYKAKDHILGRFVAIKVLKQEFSEDMNFVTKFRTEAQSAAGLEHPNIVNIYDVGSENGMHYIVMEYVEGITLKTYIEKKGQLSFKESVSIAIQVARGIEAAHNKNIIHRDIKPQNIIISTEGKVKVTDFGIARAASSNTISSDVMGSVHYASPEQARNGFVDGRSDIYSLGIVMYEMVTGRVPFDGDTTVAVAIQHLQEEMVAPSAYAPNLPISMEKIILKCTQKNADRRYQTIAELLSDLRKSLISPNEDFVVMVPAVDNGKTKVISEDELKRINEEANPQPEDSDEEGYEDGEYEDDEEDTEDPDEIEEDEDDEDEDEEGTLNPKMDKAVTIMGIVAAVVIVIVIIYLVGSVFGMFKPSKHNKTTETQTETQTETETESEEKKQVTMIDITGMTTDEAQKELDKLGLKLFVASYEESDKYEKDQIIEQDVDEGKKVAEGSTINVIVCGSTKSENMTTIPNVTGATETDAVNTLKANNLTYQKQYQYDDNVETGKVISQSLASGSQVEKKTSVTIVISQGAEPVTVQDVRGADSGSAQSTLSGQGLNVTVQEDYSDTVAQGQVISQSIDPGKTVNKGTDITIVVSKGPSVKSYSCDYTIPSLKLPDGVQSATVTLLDGNGNVLDQSTKSASELASGSAKVTKSDIQGSTSGTITVTYEETEIDEAGNPTSNTKTVTAATYNPQFTQQ